MSSPQRCGDDIGVVRIHFPTRESDLSGMAFEPFGPLRQDNARLVPLRYRDQHGRGAMRMATGLVYIALILCLYAVGLV